MVPRVSEVARIFLVAAFLVLVAQGPVFSGKPTSLLAIANCTVSTTPNGATVTTCEEPKVDKKVEIEKGKPTVETKTGGDVTKDACSEESKKADYEAYKKAGCESKGEGKTTYTDEKGQQKEVCTTCGGTGPVSQGSGGASSPSAAQQYADSKPYISQTPITPPSPEGQRIMNSAFPGVSEGTTQVAYPINTPTNPSTPGVETITPEVPGITLAPTQPLNQSTLTERAALSPSYAPPQSTYLDAYLPFTSGATLASTQGTGFLPTDTGPVWNYSAPLGGISPLATNTLSPSEVFFGQTAITSIENTLLSEQTPTTYERLASWAESAKNTFVEMGNSAVNAIFSPAAAGDLTIQDVQGVKLDLAPGVELSSKVTGLSVYGSDGELLGSVPLSQARTVESMATIIRDNPGDFLTTKDGVSYEGRVEFSTPEGKVVYDPLWQGAETAQDTGKGFGSTETESGTGRQGTINQDNAQIRTALESGAPGTQSGPSAANANADTKVAADTMTPPATESRNEVPQTSRSIDIPSQTSVSQNTPRTPETVNTPKTNEGEDETPSSAPSNAPAPRQTILGKALEQLGVLTPQPPIQPADSRNASPSGNFAPSAPVPEAVSQEGFRSLATLMGSIEKEQMQETQTAPLSVSGVLETLLGITPANARPSSKISLDQIEGDAARKLVGQIQQSIEQMNLQKTVTPSLVLGILAQETNNLDVNDTSSKQANNIGQNVYKTALKDLFESATPQPIQKFVEQKYGSPENLNKTITGANLSAGWKASVDATVAYLGNLCLRYKTCDAAGMAAGYNGGPERGRTVSQGSNNVPAETKQYYPRVVNFTAQLEQGQAPKNTSLWKSVTQALGEIKGVSGVGLAALNPSAPGAATTPNQRVFKVRSATPASDSVSAKMQPVSLCIGSTNCNGINANNYINSLCQADRGCTAQNLGAQPDKTYPEHIMTNAAERAADYVRQVAAAGKYSRGNQPILIDNCQYSGSCAEIQATIQKWNAENPGNTLIPMVNNPLLVAEQLGQGAARDLMRAVAQMGGGAIVENGAGSLKENDAFRQAIGYASMPILALANPEGGKRLAEEIISNALNNIGTSISSEIEGGAGYRDGVAGLPIAFGVPETSIAERALTNYARGMGSVTANLTQENAESIRQQVESEAKQAVARAYQAAQLNGNPALAGVRGNGTLDVREGGAVYRTGDEGKAEQVGRITSVSAASARIKQVANLTGVPVIQKGDKIFDTQGRPVELRTVQAGGTDSVFSTLAKSGGAPQIPNSKYTTEYWRPLSNAPRGGVVGIISHQSHGPAGSGRNTARSQMGAAVGAEWWILADGTRIHSDSERSTGNIGQNKPPGAPQLMSLIGYAGGIMGNAQVTGIEFEGMVGAPLTQAQIESGKELVAFLQERYGLSAQSVLKHGKGGGAEGAEMERIAREMNYIPGTGLPRVQLVALDASGAIPLGEPVSVARVGQAQNSTVFETTDTQGNTDAKVSVTMEPLPDIGDIKANIIEENGKLDIEIEYTPPTPPAVPEPTIAERAWNTVRNAVAPIQQKMQDMFKQLFGGMGQSGGSSGGGSQGGGKGGSTPAVPTTPPATPVQPIPTTPERGSLSCAPQAIVNKASTTPLTIAWKCPLGTTAEGIGFSTLGANIGTTSLVVSTTSERALYSLRCLGTPTPQTFSCAVRVLHPVVALVSRPDEVKTGESTLLRWNALDVQSCELYAPPQFIMMRGGMQGEATSLPLSQTSEFAVRCKAGESTWVSASTTVNVRGYTGHTLPVELPAE